jgi:hypothetical protein
VLVALGTATPAGEYSTGMSQANVEIVRGAFAVLTIPGDPETMIAATGPGFEMHLTG